MINNHLVKIILISITSYVTSFSLCNSQKIYHPYDVNIVGFVDDIESISRHTSSFIQCLNQDVDLTFIKTRSCKFKDLPAYFERTINKGIDLTQKKVLTEQIQNGTCLKGITIDIDSLWCAAPEYRSVPNKSIIKVVYSVAERTLIPAQRVLKINSNFDAVVVADEWFIDVYKNSGVTIPIFTLPLVLDLKSLLAKPVKTTCNKPFVFGVSAGFWPRKNHELLMQAFIAEFGDNPNVILKMHGRFGDKSSPIVTMLANKKTHNITLERKAFTRQEYENFITSLDCYVLVSKGEGFSITPREAIAAGIPCILSDNTAHKIICKSGCVRAVASDIIEPSYSTIFRRYVGCDFNCTITDVRHALRDVYQNYQNYLTKTALGRTWVKQYSEENLKPKYMNLVRPKMVILGPDNTITDHYLMTNSKTLFKKYQQLCKSTDTIFKTA